MRRTKRPEVFRGKWIKHGNLPYFDVKTCRPGSRWCILDLPMHEKDWKGIPVFMMDFEGSASSGVVEYGVVCLFSGQVRETWTALCRPTGEILARDRGVHGITAIEAQDREFFSESFRMFVDFRREGIFAAHNRHAENGFLKDTWALPPAVPDWRRGEKTSQEWGPWIDTLSIYRSLFPGLDSYALGSLVDVFGLRDKLEELAIQFCPAKRSTAHCALFDALASSLLLLRLEEEEMLRDRISCGWLLQLSQESAPQTELF